jgi:predicted PurR-regulated permease PerM
VPSSASSRPPKDQHTQDPIQNAVGEGIQVRHLAFTLLSIGIVILLLQFMQPVLIPLVLAALIFYALDPAVDWMERVHVPRPMGAALMLLVVIAGCGALAYTLQGQALTVIDELPAGARKLAASLRKNPVAEPGTIEKVQQAADALQAAEKPAPPKPGVLRVQVQEEGFQARSLLWTGSISLLSAANQVVMVLFLTYFMLLSDQLFKRKLLDIVGPLSQKKVTLSVLDDIATQIEHFMKIQIATSATVALVTWGALWAIGLKQAALWGLLAGFFNSIPYYGPLLVTAALSIVGYVQFGTVAMTALVAGVSLLITTLEGFVLTPLLVGRASSMNSVAVFAGLLFWSWVWGIWGILLAVPLMMVVKVICDRVEPLQPVGHLLGD